MGKVKIIAIGVIKDESLMKNLFARLSYFILIAGVSAVIRGAYFNSNWFVKLVASLVCLFLLVLAFSFMFIHVLRPVIKLAWPEFGIPGIDEAAERLSIWDLVTRVDTLIFSLACCALVGVSHEVFFT
jgi:hypothetical protein